MKKVIGLLLIGLWLIGCYESKDTQINKVEKEKFFSEDFYICDKKNGATTIGIGACYEKEFIYQDNKLNIAYKKAKASIQPFRVNQIKEIQRSWIKYRDIKCGFFNHKESGSSGSLDEQDCRVKETITRTKELKNIF